VQGPEFRIWGFSVGFRVPGFGIVSGFSDFRYRVWDIGYRVWGIFRISGIGFAVPERAEAGSEFPARLLRGEVRRRGAAPREDLFFILFDLWEEVNCGRPICSGKGS